MRHIVVFALLALLFPLSVAADPIQRAATQLASAQQDADKIRATWTWKRDGKTIAPNTAGVVALSLIRAWETSGNEQAKAAALRWGDARLADLETWRELYDPDVEALAALGRVSGNAAYSKAARSLFDRRWSGATPKEAVGRLSNLRRSSPSIVGYDAALIIRAARAVGQEKFAVGVARQILAKPQIWTPDRAGSGWGTTSRAALLGALQGLEGEPLPKARARLAMTLLKTQGSDGSWSQRNTQATAYAVTALAPQEDAAAAVAKGRTWLKHTQLKDGSWAAFHDGLPEPFVGDVVHEVTAEVVLALAAR